MENEGKNKGDTKGNDFSDKADEFIGKGKDFADKAGAFFSENVKKLKDSDAFGKISGAFGKVEQMMEQTSQEFQSGEMAAKIEAFKDNAENQVNEFVEKAKDAGRKIGDQVDDTLDALKGKRDRTNNQDGGGI